MLAALRLAALRHAVSSDPGRALSGQAHPGPDPRCGPLLPHVYRMLNEGAYPCMCIDNAGGVAVTVAFAVVPLSLPSLIFIFVRISRCPFQVLYHVTTLLLRSPHNFVADF